jgi:hypothetical protein
LDGDFFIGQNMFYHEKLTYYGFEIRNMAELRGQLNLPYKVGGSVLEGILDN